MKTKKKKKKKKIGKMKIAVCWMTNTNTLAANYFSQLSL